MARTPEFRLELSYISFKMKYFEKYLAINEAIKKESGDWASDTKLLQSHPEESCTND